MTSQGSAYARFRRALDRGNVTEALSAAAELEHVGLVDALELVLLLAWDGDGKRFRHGAVRWAARCAREAGDVEPAEAQAVLGLVTMLSGPRREQAAYALAQLLLAAAEDLASVRLTEGTAARGKGWPAGDPVDRMIPST
jgi:hypothetical protein